MSSLTLFFDHDQEDRKSRVLASSTAHVSVGSVCRTHDSSSNQDCLGVVHTASK